MSGPGALTACPLKADLSLGVMKPATALSRVDLPQPDGPSRTKRSAGSTSKRPAWPHHARAGAVFEADSVHRQQGVGGSVEVGGRQRSSASQLPATRAVLKK